MAHARIFQDHGQNDDENRLTSLALRSLPGKAGDRNLRGNARGSPSTR